MSEQDLLGSRIGHIRVVDFLGKGGMGAVYVGFDEKLQRRVALKAVQEGRLEAQVRARFLREARVLSQLNHRHICQIYDYLEGEERDFLVLELIDGKSLKEILTERPDNAARMRIAEQLVDVLVATHSKGIIHRDLKPSNVILTPAGNVKVLDFGLARPTLEDAATLDHADVKTIPHGEHDSDYGVTKLGVVVGTLSYMSPEQARGEPVTTASDMYSYGLVLQELFTARPAYEPGLGPADQLAKAKAGETLPVTGLDQELTSLINRLKAPAPAVRPSALDTADRLRWIREKPRRRIKRLAGLAAVGLLTLVAVGMSYQAYRIRQEAEHANRETEAARQVSEFLVRLFEVSDPGESRGNKVTARELLDKAAKDIEGRLEDQPLVKARLLHTMAKVYDQLGLFPSALALAEKGSDLRRARLPADDPALGQSLGLMGEAHSALGHYADGEKLLLRALEVQEKALGLENREVSETLENLAKLYKRTGRYAQAEPVFRRALEIREKHLGPEHRDVAETLNDLGALFTAQGKWEQAEPRLRRAVAIWEKNLGPDHYWVAIGLNNLAVVSTNLERYEEAEVQTRRALEISEKVLGVDHPTVAIELANLGSLLRDQGKYDLAEPLLERAPTALGKTLGPDHPTMARALSHQARLYQDLGQYERAEALYRRTLAIDEKALAPTHESVALDARRLALCYLDLGRRDQARPLLERALGILEKAQSPNPRQVADTLKNLALLSQAQGKNTEAERLYSRALAIQEKALGPDHIDVAETLARLGTLCQETGKEDEAGPLLMRALKIQQEAALRGLKTQNARVQSVTVLLLLGREAEARAIARQIFATGYRRRPFVELCRKHGIPVPQERAKQSR